MRNPNLQIQQIHPRAFAHPYDEAATAALKRVPLLPGILQKIAKLNVEERFRAHQMHNSIKLGPTQFGSLWALVNGVAERFGMPSPTTYIARGGMANAFAFGLNEHSVILTAELVDMMSDRELEAIVAHELAHILCEHMLYRNVGLALTSQGIVPLAKLAPGVVGPSIARLFMAWSRAAEYSADRASLLVLQDPEAVVSYLSRLAGIPKRLMGEFDPRGFAAQVEKYDEEATTWSRIVTWDLGLTSTHPEPAKRAAAILEWSRSQEYREILAGRYPTRVSEARKAQIRIVNVESCPLCGTVVGNQPVCPHCLLEQDSSMHTTCPYGHLASLSWQFCWSCGKRVDGRSAEASDLEIREFDASEVEASEVEAYEVEATEVHRTSTDG